MRRSIRKNASMELKPAFGAQGGDEVRPTGACQAEKWQFPLPFSQRTRNQRYLS